MLTPELSGRIAEWRQKALTGTLSDDDMKQAIIVLRESRSAAANATRAKKPTRSGEELLKDFL